MSSWNINPATGDYVMENGAPVPTESLTVPAYYRLKAQRGRWMYAPDSEWGSDFYLIKKRNTMNADQALIQVGEKALKPIIDDGRARNIEVVRPDEQGGSRNNAALDVSITTIEGQVQELNLPSVGG